MKPTFLNFIIIGNMTSMLHSAPSGGRVGTPTRAGEATVKPAQEAEGLWPEEGRLATGKGREGNWSVLLDSTCKQNKHLIPLWDDMNSCCRRTERSLKSISRQQAGTQQLLNSEIMCMFIYHSLIRTITHTHLHSHPHHTHTPHTHTHTHTPTLIPTLHH